jgi:hypothetical protein
MLARAFWSAITMDRSAFLDDFVALLATHGIRYCVVGGQAVNAYVEPLVSLDLDLAVAVDHLPALQALLRGPYQVEPFPHSLNITARGSDLRVQIQLDPRYLDFPDRSTSREVLRLSLPVASLADVLQGKVWAATDPARRASKRQKDLADIARLLEAYPFLRAHVPTEVLDKLL